MMSALILLLISSKTYSNDIVLVIKTEGQAFDEVLKGIKDDLEEELDIQMLSVNKSTSVKMLSETIINTNPSILILIGNQAINVYSQYQKKFEGQNFPPSLSIAALFVDKIIGNIQNGTGIRYEIPAVTSIVNMRSMLNSKVEKVGVIYRSWMKDFIEENRRYCESEGIELVAYEIPDKSNKTPQMLKKGLKSLKKSKVDAYWIINDNALLNKDALLKAWLPEFRKIKKPVIVGVDSLLPTKLNFGSYAIVPDHYALGIQGANRILDIMDDDWQLSNDNIEQPLSVKKMLNLSITKKRGITIKNSAIDKVDLVIQ